MRIRAAVAEAAGRPFAITDLELDELRDDEVRVRLVATGVCHTDSVVRSGGIPTSMPVVLGHEGAGVVEAVGASVTHVAPGDHVVLAVASCGICPACLHGHPAFCRETSRLNFRGNRADGSSAFTAADGTPVASHFFGQSSFASVVNALARSVVPIPADVPLELMGPLGCGVQTGAGTMLNVLRPWPGASVVVFGAGAVGMSAVLAALGEHAGTVIAVDIVDSRLELAREFGAVPVDGRSDDVVARVRELTGGGADRGLDTTGNGAVFRQLIDALGSGGHAALVGATAPGTEGVLDLSAMLGRGIRISWVLEGDTVPQTFIPELISRWRAGDFPFDRLIARYALDDIDRAFDDSEHGIALKPIVLF